MWFHYKAVRTGGEVYEADIEVSSKEELFKQLKERGEELVFADEISGVGWFAKLKSIQIGGVKQDARIMFARNMAAMLEAGLPISRALNVIEKQTKKGKFKEVVATMHADINVGKAFSDALDDHPKVFSPLFVAMVRAGEESGTMVEALKQVADQTENAYKLKKKVKGAMLYPSIIISAMIIIAVLMLIFVVPTLTQTFKDLNVDLPMSTQIVIFISDFMKNHIILFLGGIAAIIFGIIAASRTSKGKRFLDWIILRIPIVGYIVREVNIARTSSTLSSLLGSGVEIVRSIEITKEVVQNSYYREAMEDVKSSVQKGGQISTVLKEYPFLFPPLMSEMASVGEETGKVSELFARVGEFYQSDVEEKTKNLSTIIEPVLMVIIGAAVGFFAISMISPMYSLTSSI
jgi:type IV pilus assembly protein PilC